jgi:shikimate kinase
MKISLIGMSGIGKSHWSKKLQEQGFTRFCCDDLIEGKLETVLKELGYKGIHDVALWMGQPFEPQYAENSRKYLQYEQKMVDEVLSQIENMNDNIVIDTTGSVIYLGEDTLTKLKRLTRVIYFAASEEAKTKMYHQYLRLPKPVIWGNQFIPLSGETDQHALERCYLNLLEDRSHRYADLADMTLNYEAIREPQFEMKTWLEKNIS